MAGARPTPFIGSYPSLATGRCVDEMRAGGLAAVMFATVADLPVLGRTQRGMSAVRNFEPDEAFSDYLRQVRAAGVAFRRAKLPLARSGTEIAAAHGDGLVSGLLSIEGGDFIENRLDRIDQAATRGVRSITLVHYRTNQIGDTQTEAPVHGGLTRLGRETIRAMEAAGVLVDLSHASYDTVRQATSIATRPMLLSHSNITAAGGTHPRLISLEHARQVTGTGGLVGCVPAGFGQASFDDYVDTIFRAVDQLGIDHVAIGTDMDFTYHSVMPSYLAWPVLAGALLERGMSEAETAKVMGSNVMRILQ